MPALRNSKHELFAQELARGESATQAYEKAGYKPHRSSASKLQRQANICKRVAELQARVANIEEKATAKAIEKLAITKESVIAELAKIGFANIADYVKCVEGSEPYIDLASVPYEKMAVLSGVETETVFEKRDTGKPVEVRKVKIKLWDKRAALVDLGKHFGLFINKVEIGGPDGSPIAVEVSPRERIASRIAGLAARIGTETK